MKPRNCCALQEGLTEAAEAEDAFAVLQAPPAKHQPIRFSGFQGPNHFVFEVFSIKYESLESHN